LHQSSDLAGPDTAPAPAGPRRSADIVVFLFTDIEASTRRWEGDQDAMARDLARHDGLLLDAVEATGGEVFSHTGDGFCVAFATVRDALEAAVIAQRALLDAKWSAPVPLRVRMAVHAGAAEHRAGNWFGPTLNRTSRLLATAAGGQVVCSQVAVDLSQDELPTGVGLVDLGEHRLADLSRPERVYQVTHQDLPAEFPRLQSLDTRRHNLPLALTSFVGREQELAEVVSLLENARLLTLAGTGGAGKTRLSLQAAATALAQFPDGVWFVELASLRDPDLVTAEVVTALGFLPGGLAAAGQSLEERLCDHLKTRRLLLVLDNCEHVVDAAARVAHTVLARCPHVTILATSREVLGLPGEVVWKVPPLSLPSADMSDVESLVHCDAVALFCERARATHPGFGLSAANAEAVAAICRRLDGIPLGLELAAAKIRVLGAHQVAERLDDRFRLLGGGSRAGVPRHQTLRAAMDWSFELLPAPEQLVLRRLAVFPGSFTLDAVEAVVGTFGGFDVVDLLSRLVDKSMVTVCRDDPEVRYSLLETVREYAGQKLAEAGEVAETRTRQRDFYLALADEWAESGSYHLWAHRIQRLLADGGHEAAMEWSRAQGDHDELLRLVAAHWPYWYWTEMVGWKFWLEEALARCETPSAARVEALIALATLLRGTGQEPERWDVLLDEAMQTARRLESEHLTAQVLFYTADLVMAQGDRRSAEAMLRRALHIWESTGLRTGIGWCHFLLGWIVLSEHEPRRAAEHFEASWQRAQDADDVSMRAHVRPALALVAAIQGDHAAARALAADGVRIAEEMEIAPRVLMMALVRAGQVSVLAGDREAPWFAARILRLLRDTGVGYWADTALELAGLVLAERSPAEAATLLRVSESLREEHNDVGADFSGIGECLDRCRAHLLERLGPAEWEAARARAEAVSVRDAIECALGSLEKMSGN
ncbi:MAG TPA: AAA family ATPase, partial [Acidimicrobiia bacterium]|nr:AAA family ATPase [Acidimicrobiia bacterium]